MLYTKRFCIMKMRAQLRWIRTVEIHAQVIQGLFPSYIYFVKDRVDKEGFSIDYCNTS